MTSGWYGEQPVSVGEPLPVGELLRVLVVIADPTDLPAVNSAAEWENLQDATATAPVAITRCEPTYAALYFAPLRSSPQVVHFVGHGLFDDASQTGYLAFVGENGAADGSRPQQIGNLAWRM